MGIKGIILSGGLGSRLYPMTMVLSKHLLPIYDKPMIFYPLSTLMLAGIKEILIISSPKDKPIYQQLLGNGSLLGLRIEYAIQEYPRGIADAFIVGEEFIGDSSVLLILGDNILYGNELQNVLKSSIENLTGATIFAQQVTDPERFGIVNISDEGTIISIDEKPLIPRSNYAVLGVYLYDNDVIDIAKSIMPSERGELEITSINNIYLKKNMLNLEIFGRGMTWLDAGTVDSLIDAAEFVRGVQSRLGSIISSPEEIAWRNGWIDSKTLLKLVARYKNSGYSIYLKNLLSK